MRGKKTLIHRVVSFFFLHRQLVYSIDASSILAWLMHNTYFPTPVRSTAHTSRSRLPILRMPGVWANYIEQLCIPYLSDSSCGPTLTTATLCPASQTRPNKLQTRRPGTAETLFFRALWPGQNLRPFSMLHQCFPGGCPHRLQLRIQGPVSDQTTATLEITGGLHSVPATRAACYGSPFFPTLEAVARR